MMDEFPDMFLFIEFEKWSDYFMFQNIMWANYLPEEAAS